jgi:regulator of protease activity HflC (stomatin/prohibitin superfamily)
LELIVLVGNRRDRVLRFAEGKKEAAILGAVGSRQAAFLEAEGLRQAAFMRAEAREREAQAEAKATELVSNAIKSGDTASINYFVAQKYLEALAKFADSKNEKLLILPTEITGVIGSLAGIAEIAQRAFSKSSGPRD